MAHRDDLNLAGEWLETDKVGGFAMGTIGGAATRRYHALLCAATRPPGGRMVLVNTLDEIVRLPDGREFALDSHHYPGNTTWPDGAHWLVDFRRLPWPRWRYVVGDLTVERELLMGDSPGTTVLRWRASGPAEIVVRPLCTGRDYHALHKQNAALQQTIRSVAGGFAVQPYPGVPAIYFGHDGDFGEDWRWYHQMTYPLEAERGLDSAEDLWSPGRITFQNGGTLTLSTRTPQGDVARAFDQAERLRNGHTPIDHAAEQFLVRRGEAPTIIAGYPWFTDWGRDTLIAMPGLRLAPDDQLALLRLLARHQREGLIPNRFLDDGSAAEYNAADATLWFLLAIATWGRASGGALPPELEAAARAVVDRYLGGTDFNIHVDDDGFVHAASPGWALTWMDARVDGVPVTPRSGAAVELQALWVAALEGIAPLFAHDVMYAHELVERAEWTRSSFTAKFWYEEGGYLYDAIDGPVRDATLRPNQLYALGLCEPLVDAERATSALRVIERDLLTPYGLRSRGRDPAYVGTLTGTSSERDRAYHQGTVWSHLMGIYADACVRVRGSFDVKLLDHLVQYLDQNGSIAEVYDGDAPHRPRGCPAQAWSVAELRRILDA